MSRDIFQPDAALEPLLPSEQKHVCFTADSTAYMRNLDDETRGGAAYAVHYQAPPVRVPGGTRFSVIFPLLLVTAYAKDAQAIAERVAQILEKHWDDEEAAHG